MSKNEITKAQSQITTNEAWQKDLALFNPKSCQKHAHKLKTVQDAIRLPSKTLAQLQKKHSYDQITALLEMWLLDLNEFIDLKNGLSQAQIEFTAGEILTKYPLKITDLTLFFKQIKSGHYGELYESLSPAKILNWLKKYWDERLEIAAMTQKSKHDGFSLMKDKAHPDIVDKIFKGIGEEPVEYDTEKNGLGKRERERQYADVLIKVKQMPTKALRQCLIEADVKSGNYDQFFIDTIERELDLRNN